MASETVRKQRDRGTVTAFVGVLIGLGVLLPVTALVVDVGSIYVESQELTSGADAAAMAVARECLAGNCATADVPSQLTRAKLNAGANAKDGRTSITELCGSWDGLPACSTPTRNNLSTCIGDEPAGNYVEVRVHTEMGNGSTLLPPALARTFVGNETYDGTTVGGCARVAADDVCVTADEATYTHTFNGPAGEASITADRALCPTEKQPFTLVSYTAPSSYFTVPQYIYDYETKTIDADTRSLTFKVDVPGCYNQVDFVFGSQAVNPLYGIVYGDKKVGSSGAPGNRSVGPPAWYNGGTRACDPRPAATFTAQCDGTMKVKLTSGSGANVDAVFTVTAGGKSTIYRVPKGSSKTITISASVADSVAVQDNEPEGSTFSTVTGQWSKPTKC
ncbi:MAG: hypothetical protein KJO75_09445 [Dactylosporangium sp.]|nr:hypothetical protein [Dactylosporangium sp.]